MPFGPVGSGATPKVFRFHLLGNADQRIGILVEHGAGPGVETGHDLVETPADAILRRIAVLVDISQHFEALDGARLIERRGAIRVEIATLAIGDVHEHLHAVETAGTAAQAVAILALDRRDLLVGFHEFVERLRRFFQAGFARTASCSRTWPGYNSHKGSCIACCRRQSRTAWRGRRAFRRPSTWPYRAQDPRADRWLA